MEQFHRNQRALSLGYIALKRIRALETSATRLPSSPLLRHLSHIKILTACVEEVGPEEIIAYERNQDIARDEREEALFVSATYGGLYDAHMPRRHVTRCEADDDVFDERYRISSKLTNTTKPLEVIKEDYEDVEEKRPIDRDIVPLKPLLLTQPTCTDFDMDDGDYSMDELYDEYNTQEDGWETASDVSDEDNENQPPPRTNNNRPATPTDTDTAPLPSPTSEVDELEEEEEDFPSTPPNNIVISRSPPLDITMRHPITHTLNKREQYRKETEQVNSELSCGFVEQIEDVICQQMQYLSIRGIPGQMRLDSHAHGPQRVSLYA